MKRILAAMTAALMIVATFGTATVAAGNGTGITATPASTQSWDGCTGTFVRSASGIINLTNRVCDPAEVPALRVQFRPLTGPSGGDSLPTPNPACDPAGLVRSMTGYTNPYPAPLAGTTATGYFINSNPYNVCFYFVNPVVASGTINAASQTGTTVTLPSYPFVVNGRYRIDVSGTWNNTSHGLVDAEFNNGDNSLVWQDGWPGLGEGWGDVLVNGGLVDWGAFNASHAYSYTLSTSGTITLNVFDGDATSGLVYNPGWYSDNVGSLTYTITYLGLQLLAVGLGIDYVIMSGNLVAH